MVASAADLSLMPKVDFTFVVAGAEPAWRIRHFDLTEPLSEPYRCTLELISIDSLANPHDLLGASCTLEINRGMLQRRLHGVIFSVEDRGTTHGHVVAKAELAPALFVASLGSNTRMFQGKTVPEIIEEVLEEPLSIYHRDCDLRLSATYPKREYCVQYQESDLDFVRRLAAEEGISFFFDHGGDEELVVFVDSNDAFPTCATLDGNPVPASGQSAAAGYVECLFSFGAAREIGVSRIVVHEFDWTRPAVDFTKPLENKEGGGPDREIYDPSPRHTLTDYSDGDLRYTRDHLAPRAQVGLERAQARDHVFTGSSNVTNLSAGSVFEAAGNALSDLDQEYVVLNVTHVGRSSEELASREGKGEEEEVYRNWAECIPASVPFRPPLPSPRPSVLGLLTAIVVGPPGEEIHTDPHGRIKVQFHWARDDKHKPKRPDKSSCWVRVAQTWAGPGWGTVFIPRVGMEVLVQFIEGDPDRPLVIGCVYNGENRPPLSLPEEKTRSILRTASSPGSAGHNELRFEDATGSEEIWIHAQKDMNEEVEHDHTVTVHNDERLTVDQNQGEIIGVDQSLVVKGNRTKTVEKDESITVNGSRTTVIYKDETVTVKGSRTEVVSGAESLEIDKNQDVLVKGNRTTVIEKNETRQLGMNRTTAIKQNDTLTVKQAMVVSADKELQLQQGKTTLTLKENRVELNAGGEIKIVHDCGAIQIEASGAIKITSDKPAELVAGGCSVKMASGTVVIKGSKTNVN